MMVMRVQQAMFIHKAASVQVHLPMQMVMVFVMQMTSANLVMIT